jgi:ATP-binding cassette, subfamily C (CFTR/MRP), member 1
LVAATAVCVLSFLEHGRNVGPSTLLTSFLVIAILSDVIQAGLLYVAWKLCNPWGLASAIFATRCVLLILEGRTKRSILREPYDKLSPEETAGFFGVAFFWWVNKVLKTGYCNVFTLDDMPPLGEGLDIMKTREAMQREWDKRSTYTLVSSFFAFRLTNQTQKSQWVAFLYFWRS